MDNKGRLFGKINIIDLLVLLVAVIAVAGLGYKFTRSNTPASFVKYDVIEVEYYVEEAPDFVVDVIKAGDPVKEGTLNTAFGTVTGISKGPAVHWIDTADGKCVYTTKEGYSSLKATIKTEGFFGKNGVSINNADYYVGRTLIMYIGNAAVYGRISGIRVIG